MHVWSVLTNSFPVHLFWTSVLCIIELYDASGLVLCLLTDPSEFVVDFVKILTQVGKFGKLNIKIHGVLPDACSLVILLRDK